MADTRRNAPAPPGRGSVRRRSASRTDAALSTTHATGVTVLPTASQDNTWLWHWPLGASFLFVLLVVAAFTASYRPFGMRAGAARIRGPQHCMLIDDETRVRVLGAQQRLLNRTVASVNPGASVLFNLGMLALTGFNAQEATESFQACLRIDPGCAMCHWGLALTKGPTPNLAFGAASDPFPTFTPASAAQALAHAKNAMHHHRAAAITGNFEAKLMASEEQRIVALLGRFREGSHLTQSSWLVAEEAYAESMSHIAEEEQDPDAYALAAEAHMNLGPWDYYDEAGQLLPHAAAAQALLLRAIALRPSHPHALHLHVHLTEAGVPGSTLMANEANGVPLAAARGIRSADALSTAAPPDGHLRHMPSHVYVRVGRYADAVAVNKAAYEADISISARCGSAYVPEHNMGVLIWAASMAGMRDTAEAYGITLRELGVHMPHAIRARGTEWVSLPLLYIRYGEWHKLLELAAPPSDARAATAVGGPQFARVVYHTARLLALAAKAAHSAAELQSVGDLEVSRLGHRSLEVQRHEVTKEQAYLEGAIASVPSEPLTRPGAAPGIYASAYTKLAAIMGALARARLALLRNDTGAAAGFLQDGIRVEDSIGYIEPPRTQQPLRQCLAWIYLTSGELKKAAQVYKEDLAMYPDNGWSWLGLLQIHQVGGTVDKEVVVAYKKAWASAETSIESSCPALSRNFASRKL